MHTELKFKIPGIKLPGIIIFVLIDMFILFLDNNADKHFFTPNNKKA